jgi:hypothetical protein
LVGRRIKCGLLGKHNLNAETQRTRRSQRRAKRWREEDEGSLSANFANPEKPKGTPQSRQLEVMEGFETG